MGKIIVWTMANGATLLGLLQAIIKALKELATGVVNLLSLLMPQSAAKKAVEVVRGIFNKVDDGIEFVKKYLIK
jgi:hypothetical protein